MKNLVWAIIIIMVFSAWKTAFSENDQPEIQILPMPQKLTLLDGTFRMTRKTSIKTEKDLIEEGGKLRDFLTPATGFILPINKEISSGPVIELKLSEELSSLGQEGYQLNVSPNKILIEAYKPKGVFWGIQSLRQLFPSEILREARLDHVNWTIPCLKIVDKPRFKWRGLMIDYSRTFWDLGHTKKYIDVLSYYKMNKLHMHLTDDQGWRLEIDQYPALTEVASKFDTTYHESPERQGYYTKEDIQEIVRYAKARNVEIIPEIEMPGHSSEVFTAYPELSCNGEKSSIHPFFEGPSIHKEIFCAGNEKTFDLLENVLYEVSELFPSEYIHIGGDEAPKEMWENCPKCQHIIDKYGLKNEEELQSWFIKRIEKFLKSQGKKMIGWDEIIKGGLSESAVVMFWRTGKKEAVSETIAQSNKIILSPTSHCYFDYSYDKTPIKEVYSFHPINGFKQIAPNQILGIQANFWSHIHRTPAKMDRQIFPRILALAEVGWTDPSNKKWCQFKLRMKDHFKSLKLLDLYYTDN